MKPALYLELCRRKVEPAVRNDLTTSALPKQHSTTELRRRFFYRFNRNDGIQIENVYMFKFGVLAGQQFVAVLGLNAFSDGDCNVWMLILTLDTN